MLSDKGNIQVNDGTQDGRKRVTWECAPSQFLAIASRLKEAQARLVTIYGSPEPGGDVKLYYFFDLEQSTCVVRTRTEKTSIGSLYTLFVNADFIEREINNLFKIKFLGHPNLPRYGSGEE